LRTYSCSDDGRGSVPCSTTNNKTPTVLGFGFFWSDRASSRVFAGVRVEACGLRLPAESPFRATFPALLGILRSDLAPWNWPEVRKGRNAEPYRSMGYARTNQVVGLQHWVEKETLSLCFVDSYRPYRHIATRMHVHGRGSRQETTCQDTVRTTTMGASKVRRGSS